MRIIKNLLFVLLSIISLSVKADIYSAATIEELNNSLMGFLEKRAPEKTLVVLPLEIFFVEPTNPAFYVTDDKFQVFITRASNKAKLSRKKYLKELILTQYEQRFSDPMVQNLLGTYNKRMSLLLW